jgi:hypothetical protein
MSSMALMQATVWFPLLLWLADRVMESTDRGRTGRLIGGTGLLFGMLILVGNAQIVFYEALLLACYLVGHVFSAREGRGWRLGRSAGMLGWMLLAGGLIGAVIWVPAREFAALTVRESVDVNFYKLGTWLTPSRLASAFYFPAYGQPTEMVHWASSLIYIGLLPSMLALLRLMGIRVNWQKDAPLVVMGAVALFLAFGWNNPANHLLVKIPPFSMLRYQGRFALGAMLALIGLGSAAISDVRFERKDVTRALIIVFISVFFFLLNAKHSAAILWGAFVLVADIALTWWAIATMGKSVAGRFPFWAAAYLLFHLVIVFPIGRIATMPAARFQQALTFFDQLHRSDGLPPRLLVIDVGRFADRDLLAFNKFIPQDNLPNLCAGNTSVFKGVQTMDPYTPLMPKEWEQIISEKIEPGFARIDESGILDSNTSGQIEVLGVDYVVTSGRATRILGFRPVDLDLSLAFGPNARMFVSDRQRPRLMVAPDREMTMHAAGEMRLTPNGAEIDVPTTVPSNCLIEISKDPNWVVTLDGEKVEPKVVNTVFQGVHIANPGQHRIEMRYEAGSVVTGGIMSLVGLLLAAGWLLLAGRGGTSLDTNPHK